MFFLKTYLMTITQHAHIYSFHTSKFIFGQIIVLKFLSIPPLTLLGVAVGVALLGVAVGVMLLGVAAGVMLLGVAVGMTLLGVAVGVTLLGEAVMVTLLCLVCL